MNDERTLITHPGTQDGRQINVFDPALALWETSGEQLRFSHFCHPFHEAEVVALYHSLTHQTVFLPLSLYRTVQKSVDTGDDLRETEYKNIALSLIHQGMLVSLGYSEKAAIEAVQNVSLGKPSFGILYLLLTDACNLRCTYCFIEGAMPTKTVLRWMTPETAVRAIRLFANTMAKNPPDRKIGHPTVVFYGGEPLLNQKTFVAAVEEITRLKYTGELPDSLSITLITNGTAVTDRMVAVIKEHAISVSVSLDGPKEMHDRNRFFADGRGSFGRIQRSLRKLQDAGVNLSISCTINEANLERLDDVFRWIVFDLGIRGLGFNLLIDTPGTPQTDGSYAQRATEKIIACYEIARREGVYEDRVMRKVNAFVQRKLHVADCGGYGNQLAITPDGKIGPCQAFVSSGQFFPGDVRDTEFDPFSDSTFLEWSRRSPFNMPNCYFCEAVGLCGGGCAYNAALKGKSIWEKDPNFCIHSKTLLRWLIWDLFRKTKEKGGERIE